MARNGETRSALECQHEFRKKYPDLERYIYKNDPAVLAYAPTSWDRKMLDESLPTNVPRIDNNVATLLMGPVLLFKRKIVIVTYSIYEIPNQNILNVVRLRKNYTL